MKQFDRINDKDLLNLKKAIENLRKKGVTIELIDDMILLIDNNAEQEDQVIESLGGCG